MNRRPPAWMSIALWAAAADSICWGAWAVFFPLDAFRLAGVREPYYPELAQCLGVLIALIGLGYAIGAGNPFNHWPAVLVGLLAKVVGPIALLLAVSAGRLPVSIGWFIVANGFVWSIPLGIILASARRAHLSLYRSRSPEVLSIALRSKTTEGLPLEELSRSAPLMLVFLRHAGCTFCRQALADIARQRRRIEASGTTVVLVHMGERDFGRTFFARYGLSDVPQISDPEQTLYRAFGLPRGGLWNIFGPAVWWRGIRASIIDGHGVGRLVGDGFQMPGVFLVFHGQVIRSYRHRTVADRPDYVRFVSADLAEALS